MTTKMMFEQIREDIKKLGEGYADGTGAAVSFTSPFGVARARSTLGHSLSRGAFSQARKAGRVERK